MAKGINTSRMRFRLEFGKDKPTGKINPNTGQKMRDFVPKFKKWAGIWTLSQSDTINLAGANIRDAVVFFVRHNSNITSDYLIRKGDKIYKITSIAYDDGLTTDGFDLITCQRSEVNHG